jgi:hypothetical protein
LRPAKSGLEQSKFLCLDEEKSSNLRGSPSSKVFRTETHHSPVAVIVAFSLPP